MSDPPASQALYDGIRTLILSVRQTVARGVDLLQVHTNYEIGRRIVEQEQQGAERAQYGKEILRELAARLTAEFGKGFSRSNLEYMRRFYLVYPDRSSRIIPQTASGNFLFLHTLQLFQFPRRRLGNPPRPTRAHNSPLPSAGLTTSSSLVSILSLYLSEGGSFLDWSCMRIPFRGQADFADKLLSAMRYEFGGHIEKPAAK
jgi:DUF1016 N-terminal domain